MTHPYKRFFSALALMLSISFSAAQKGNLAAGGDAVGSGGSVSYSYGQPVYTTVADNSITITQGIQQPYEIIVLTDNLPAYQVFFDLTAYPNPTPDFLTVKTSGPGVSGLACRIYAENGKLLETKPMEDGETIISFVNFSKGIYFLKLTGKTGEIKTCKIIKN